MIIKLIVVGGKLDTPEIDLALPAVVGRGQQAQLSIPHRLVSRRHCEFAWKDDQLIVRDLHSLNGTYVGKERVEESIVESGDLITIGPITFRAVYERSLPEAGPPISSAVESAAPASSESEDQTRESTDTVAWDGMLPSEAEAARKAGLASYEPQRDATRPGDAASDLTDEET